MVIRQPEISRDRLAVFRLRRELHERGDSIIMHTAHPMVESMYG